MSHMKLDSPYQYLNLAKQNQDARFRVPVKCAHLLRAIDLGSVFLGSTIRSAEHIEVGTKFCLGDHGALKC
jgi:hypothetical protein